jgi:hypothetical protein
VHKLSCPISKLECHLENVSYVGFATTEKSDIYRVILSPHQRNLEQTAIARVGMQKFEWWFVS